MLAEYDEQDLFIKSKNRGLNLSYTQTKGFVGGYYKFNFGEDIPLSENMAPSVQRVPQLRYNVDFQRIAGATTANFQLNTALIYDGTCTIIKNSSCIKQRSVLDSNDVIEILQRDYDMVHPSAYENNNFGGRISGGALLLLSVLSSALLIARMIKGAVQKGAPIVKVIVDGAEKIGLGNAGAMSIHKNKKKKEGGMVITRNQLQDDMY